MNDEYRVTISPYLRIPVSEVGGGLEPDFINYSHGITSSRALKGSSILPRLKKRCQAAHIKKPSTGAGGVSILSSPYGRKEGEDIPVRRNGL